VVGASGSGQKGGPSGRSRTAEQPGQTLNVDLCFVPASHALADKLPAVSGSSGRLVVERPAEERTVPTWPGQAFDDPSRDYAEAMAAFVAASRAGPAPAPTPGETAAAPSDRAAQRALRQAEAALRAARRQERAQRRQADAAWQTLRQQHRAASPSSSPPPSRRPAPARPGRRPRVDRAARQAEAARWRALRAQRRAEQARRQQADAAWRQERQRLRARLTGLTVTAWIALLVITDNCTRQCLGLPLFVTGPKVTADLIVAALRALLPADLQFLISDRGVHFTAQVFEQLAYEQGFVHVVIARHRPESNGIAERFVRTLKEWLADQEWTTAAELAALLNQFRAEYNDRPHQGLALPGLSPNEFADRLWLL
jgi:transposase InsO family protein